MFQFLSSVGTYYCSQLIFFLDNFHEDIVSIIKMRLIYLDGMTPNRVTPSPLNRARLPSLVTASLGRDIRLGPQYQYNKHRLV